MAKQVRLTLKDYRASNGEAFDLDVAPPNIPKDSLLVLLYRRTTREKFDAIASWWFEGWYDPAWKMTNPNRGQPGQYYAVGVEMGTKWKEVTSRSNILQVGVNRGDQ